MKLNKFIAYFFVLSLFMEARAQQAETASLGKVKMTFTLDQNGTPFYEITYDNRPVLLPSRLGFKLNVDSVFYTAFHITGTERKSFDQTWQPVWGETKEIRNHYEELTIHLQSSHSPGRLVNMIFRVFEDGVGFRYEFPLQPDLKYFIVADEMTQFNLAGNNKAFWIPGDFDSNEYLYTTSMISEVDNRKMVETSTDIAVRVAPDPYAVQTPLMMKTADGLYLNIHEAALVNYSAMQLHVDRKNFSLTASLVPDAYGNKAYLHAPFKTPWRTIIVTDKATDILSSKLILNLNEPSAITNTSWIRPMKFVGVWWEMQTDKKTWRYSDFPDSLGNDGKLIPNGKHGAATANVKRYIDFASANNIQGVLVEGWNMGWESWFGNWKENVFDFTKPYPDFDIAELTRYAASKNINLIMHNETSGSATDYERQMDTAFRFMNLFGYTSVKTGYVGRIIPRGEHHDGQWMIDHYLRVAKKAAEHHVMLDSHEPVRPTGLQRTWPNWMASEAARGNEYNAFSIGSPPEHETILPFTRLMGGPMDYTPGIFKMKGYNMNVPARQMHSTLCKQLALYVTMYSPLQMAADLPENYELHKDAFQFIRDVATDWDDTRILAAEPGDYIYIARKEKNSARWFIGAITDETNRAANLSLSFLDPDRKYVATIYRDGMNADWKDNPEVYTIEKYTVDRNSNLRIGLAKGGGAAISIFPASETDSKKIKMYKNAQ
ncbi:MAG: glycoside hydrolase family 97 protein [Bacteroidota bacterium]|nr:glycoside hydrolase family 97 protein [Bacteroidota bacterium]